MEYIYTPPRVFACYNKSKKIIKKSTSGGIFYVFAHSIINDFKGVVYGCVMQNGKAMHVRAVTIDGIALMLGSKYVKSNLNKTFLECKKDLENQKHVLFSGTPCQINSLLFFLEMCKTDRSKLLTIDLICHGTPMPKYWNKYIESNFGGEPFLDVNFRFKTKDNSKQLIKINNYISTYEENPFMSLFLENKIMMDSCYHCDYKGENRKADVTLGDFWEIEKVFSGFANKNGTSLVIVRNRIAINLLKKTCKMLEVPYISSLFDKNEAYYLSVKKKKIEDHFSYRNITNSTNYKHTNTNLFNKTYKKTFNKLKMRFIKYPHFVYSNTKKRTCNGKIGIITDYGYYNFGNRLQNYAIHTLLLRLGKKPVNIFFEETHWRLLYRFYRFIKYPEERKPFPYKEKMYKVSKCYENINFKFSNTKKRQKQLCRFESVLVGSDQIWNPVYHSYRNDLEYSLGNFGILNRPFKLFSYGSSICTHNIDDRLSFLFFNSLKMFDSISVREKPAQEMLKNIGIKTEVVVDPTFLLDYKDWNDAINKYSNIEAPKIEYVFKYFLGNDAYLSNDFTDMFVVDCLDKTSNFYNISQFDFIKLIRYSKHVITDSYHALIFSIIFSKKIILVKRNYDGMTMDDRINEIFDILGMKIVYGELIDFSIIDRRILNSEISRSFSYFINSVTK